MLHLFEFDFEVSFGFCLKFLNFITVLSLHLLSTKIKLLLLGQKVKLVFVFYVIYLLFERITIGLILISKLLSEYFKILLQFLLILLTFLLQKFDLTLVLLFEDDYLVFVLSL